jgi:hypothetical protein
MLQVTVAFSLIIAASPAAFADSSTAGTLVAAMSEMRDVVTIHRITLSGIDKVATFTIGQKADLAQIGWTDATTLWMFTQVGSESSVAKIVDGKVSETIVVQAADWKLGGSSAHLDVSMVITEGNEVWLEDCLRRKGELYNEHQCLKGVYLRVDAKPFARSTTKPKRVDAYRVAKNFQEGKPQAFPKASAPAGYAVKLSKVSAKDREVSGAVCTGPSNAAVSWPGPDEDLDFAMKPKHVTWVHASPAVARIEGKATNPIGIVEDDEAWFFDCKELVADAEFFGGALWGIERGRPAETGHWSIYDQDKLVGTVEGSYLRVAPH